MPAVDADRSVAHGVATTQRTVGEELGDADRNPSSVGSYIQCTYLFFSSPTSASSSSSFSCLCPLTTGRLPSDQSWPGWADAMEHQEEALLLLLYVPIVKRIPET